MDFSEFARLTTVQAVEQDGLGISVVNMPADQWFELRSFVDGQQAELARLREENEDLRTIDAERRDRLLSGPLETIARLREENSVLAEQNIAANDACVAYEKRIARLRKALDRQVIDEKGYANREYGERYAALLTRAEAAEWERDEAQAYSQQLVETGDDLRGLVAVQVKDGCGCVDHDPCAYHEALIGWDEESEAARSGGEKQ